MRPWGALERPPGGMGGQNQSQVASGGPGNPAVAEGKRRGGLFGLICILVPAAQGMGWLSGWQLKRKLVIGCCCAAAAGAFRLYKGALQSKNRQPGSLGVLFGGLLARE